MTIAIELDVPEQAVQNYEQSGVDWKTQARKMVEDRFFPDAISPIVQDSDVKRKAAIAWFRSIAAEAEQMTDEEKQEAAAEDAELIRNLNAVRAENGERLL